MTKRYGKKRVGRWIKSIATTEQTLADQRARMLAAGVTDEQTLADARRRALETGVITA